MIEDDFGSIPVTDPVAQKLLRELREDMDNRLRNPPMSNSERFRLYRMLLVIPVWFALTVVDGLVMANMNEVPGQVGTIIVSLIAGVIATAVIVLE